MDPEVKVSVIYYSATGHTAEIARELAETAEKAGAEVRLRRVAELAPPAAIAANRAWSQHAAAASDISVASAEDLVWADAVLIGSPTRFGNVAAQLKQFLDTLGGVWQKGLLADKVYGAFTSAGTLHGGHESTLLALATTFHHFGGILVPPGYTNAAKFGDGNPYGTSFHDAGGAAAVDDTAFEAARVQARRVVDVARALRRGVEAA